jgi:hypothetical protein
MAIDTIARALYREGYRAARDNPRTLFYNQLHDNPYTLGIKSQRLKDWTSDPYAMGGWLIRRSVRVTFWRDKVSDYWLSIVERQQAAPHPDERAGA